MTAELFVLSLFALPLIMGALFILYAELRFFILPPISTKKVGGLQFIKIGRFCLSFCVTSNPRPFHQ